MVQVNQEQGSLGKKVIGSEIKNNNKKNSNLRMWEL
jgi:hypothetical protein